MIQYDSNIFNRNGWAHFPITIHVRNIHAPAQGKAEHPRGMFQPLDLVQSLDLISHWYGVNHWVVAMTRVAL